jgi:hypothetical protein
MPNKKPQNELFKIFWVSLGIIFSGAVFILIFIILLSRDLPSLEQLENYDPDLVTRIYSADGVDIIYGGKCREWTIKPNNAADITGTWKWFDGGTVWIYKNGTGHSSLGGQN